MVFLFVLGIAGFASRGIPLIILMHSMRRCDCGFFYVLGVDGLLQGEFNLPYDCTQ